MKRVTIDRCFGCGALGSYCCKHCAELVRLLRERIEKITTTVEQRFAKDRHAP